MSNNVWSWGVDEQKQLMGGLIELKRIYEKGVFGVAHTYTPFSGEEPEIHPGFGHNLQHQGQFQTFQLIVCGLGFMKVTKVLVETN